MSKKDDAELVTWIKADGKTKIKLNTEKATEEEAKRLGWKKEGSK